MSPICASWPVNRVHRLQRHLDPLRVRTLPLELAAQRQHPDLHPGLPAAGAGHRDLELQLHRPGPELNRLPLAGRLCRAQLTAHRSDRVRQARELTVSVTHAKHPLHLASSRHTRPQRQQLPEREAVLSFPHRAGTRPATSCARRARTVITFRLPAGARRPAVLEPGSNSQRLLQLVAVGIGPPGGQLPADGDGFLDRGQRVFPPSPGRPAGPTGCSATWPGRAGTRPDGPAASSR